MGSGSGRIGIVSERCLMLIRMQIDSSLKGRGGATGGVNGVWNYVAGLIFRSMVLRYIITMKVKHNYNAVNNTK